MRRISRILYILIVFIFCMILIPADVHASGDIVASGTCGAEGDGSNLIWTLDSEGVLTISGEGAMADYYTSSVPWSSNWQSITKVIIGDKVTTIGALAFY